MIHLLDNYTFSPSLRYDAHRLIYTYSEKEEPIQIEGFLGAALLCVCLINSDEGERREIPLDIERKQDFLFSRYEQEVIADGWGYLEAELRQLNDAYIQLTVSQVPIVDVCANVRQFSIAMSLLSAYMQRLVTEEFGEHIWEKETWHMPFSQWLFDAGYTETVRQRFLHIDWTDPVAVNALVEMPEQRSEEPSFIFEGEEAEEIIRRYWEWLSNTAQKEAALFPDKNVMMAEFKENILAQETNYEDLKPEMKDFTPDQLNLFRKWMNQWIDFVKTKIEPPVSTRKKDIRQEFFPDNITPIPPPNDYSAVREYIHERCKYDTEFKKYQKSHYLTDLCQQLTFVFDWPVEYNSLYKSLKRRLKHPKKDHLHK